MGETVSQITKDMDTYSYRVPLGVCAGITPYVDYYDVARFVYSELNIFMVGKEQTIKIIDSLVKSETYKWNS